jgi:hypothetical protein
MWLDPGTPESGASAPMTDRNDDDLVGADPIIDTIGKSQNASDPNITTLDA